MGNLLAVLGRPDPRLGSFEPFNLRDKHMRGSIRGLARLSIHVHGLWTLQEGMSRRRSLWSLDRYTALRRRVYVWRCAFGTPVVHGHTFSFAGQGLAG